MSKISVLLETIKSKYPRYKSNLGYEYDCIGWGISLKNGWEWYALEKTETPGEYFGYVMGFENELGYFNVRELESIGVKLITDPKKLKELMPPDGWERIDLDEI